LRNAASEAALAGLPWSELLRPKSWSSQIASCGTLRASGSVEAIARWRR
jgi:hypothetical protein